MVTYNTVFADVQYRAIAKKAAQYFQESAKTSIIPAIYTDVPDALQYRYTQFSKSKVSQAVVENWSPQGAKAITEHGYTDFKLTGKEMHLHIPKSSINHWSDANLIADKHAAQIKQFALDVDLMNLIGNYDDPDDRDAVLDAGGLLTQATSVIDLNGTDSNLVVKGDIWKGITKMIDAIPFRYRESSPPMILFASENIIKKARAPDRIYQDKTEWNFIYDNLIGPEALIGRKIGSVVITNNILVYGTDTTGTHDRLLLVIPDSNLVARVVSRSFSLLDEEQIMFNIHQAWGYRGSLCVFDANGAQFSEQIVWA